MNNILQCLSKLWPRRLIGQTILLLIVALLSAQVISAWIIRGDARSLYRGAETRFLAERIAPYAALLRDTPPALHDKVAATFSSRRLYIWVSEAPVVIANDTSKRDHDDDEEDKNRGQDLARHIASEMDPPPTIPVRVFMRHHSDDDDDDKHHRMMRVTGTMDGAPPRARNANVFVSIAVGEHRWMNAAVQARPPRRLIRPDSWITFFVTALVISVIVAFALRRITTPLNRLSEAASKLGRGETVAPLPEGGPADVRDAIRAFNEMQRRLQKFVQDRTRMLAAISHDLRTPITSLRLRAEMLDDEEARTKMIATLNEMQQMVEATLAFAREEASDEQTRPTDLGAMITAIADDLESLDLAVTYEEEARIVYPCRPASLRRALNNLIQNGATYGKRARVHIHAQDQGNIHIIIEDDGPGIPEAQQDQVFEPFVRLETSRSTKTGGVGLGLAIARDIIHRHGGQIELENRSGGGLTVRVTLPRDSISS